MRSVKLLSEEVIKLLHTNNLLKPLLKAEYLKEVLSNVSIDKNKEEKEINALKEKLDLSDEINYQKWLTLNHLNSNDFKNLALKDLRLKAYCKKTFDHKAESRFLERKSQLDIVVYSLIRVKDIFTAKEIYLRISENESDFGDLASLYSEGIERRTRGLVGPIPLGQAHPALIEVLRTSQPGNVQPPFEIDGSHLVVRVESYDPAQLDDFMREKMTEELFNQWIEVQVNRIHNSLINPKQSLNDGEES